MHVIKGSVKDIIEKREIASNSDWCCAKVLISPFTVHLNLTDEKSEGLDHSLANFKVL